MRRITSVLLTLVALTVGILLAHVSTASPRAAAPPTNTRRPDMEVALAGTVTSTVTRTATPRGTSAATAASTAARSSTAAGTRNAAANAQSTQGTPVLATLTPSNTLKAPPTFEPPTATSAPSLTPSVTATQTLDLSINIPGLIGLETATVVGAGCTPRTDWKLTYTVQFNDALQTIADRYNTTVDALAKGNCLKDKNTIFSGQVLKVPGTAQPYQPDVPCVPYQILTPFNGTMNVVGGGSITFTWHGPRSPYNMIWIYLPDGTQYKDVVEIRQNETIDAQMNLYPGGTYKWYIYPLDHNFIQDCPEGGPYYFTKAQAPTPTPTINVSGSTGSTGSTGKSPTATH